MLEVSCAFGAVSTEGFDRGTIDGLELLGRSKGWSFQGPVQVASLPTVEVGDGSVSERSLSERASELGTSRSM